MNIQGSGPQPAIAWQGGNGTFSFQNITPAMNYPKIPDPQNPKLEVPTVPGNPGDWNGAQIVMEASFNNGNTWREITAAGVRIIYEENIRESKNFSSSACLVRANIISGATSGEGLVFGLNGRGQ